MPRRARERETKKVASRGERERERVVALSRCAGVAFFCLKGTLDLLGFTNILLLICLLIN